MPRQLSLCCLLALVLALAGRPDPGTAQTPVKQTARPAHEALVQRTYAVADLVVPLETTSAAPSAEAAKSASGVRVTGEAPRGTVEGRLIGLIQSAVAPHSWSDRGGPATIDYYPLGMSLVVKQSPAAQEQVAALLESLRRQLDVEVATEIRMVTLSDDGFERLGLDCHKDAAVKVAPDAASSPKLLRVGSQIFSDPDAVREYLGLATPHGRADVRGVSFLNDQQLRTFFERVQSDRRTNIMQAPKITTFNGQAAAFELMDQCAYVTGVEVARQGDKTIPCPKTEKASVGLRFALQPTVSADRRYVQVRLKVDHVGVAKPAPAGRMPQLTKTSLEQQFSVPDGGTAVLFGWKEPREQPAAGKDADGKTASVLLFITPRIILNQPQEQRLPTRTTARTPPVTAPRADAAEEAEAPADAAKSKHHAKKLAKLLDKYEHACREGRRDDAAKYALKAITLDPTCFHRPATPAKAAAVNE